jgi:hypothetical protein
MSCLAYPSPQLVSPPVTPFRKLSTLSRELPKVSPLVLPTHPDAVRVSCQTQLPEKKLLQAKLHEFYLANVGDGDAE